MYGNFFTVLQHTILDILLPTADVFGDINFAMGAFFTRNVGIGFLMIWPMLLNVMFILRRWFLTDFDNPHEKRFTWLLALLNMWPQYQAFKLILLILRGKPNDKWKPLQSRFKKELSFAEPIIEAVPQFFTSVCVYYLLLARSATTGYLQNPFEEVIHSSKAWSKNDRAIVEVFGKTTLGIDNDIMYPLSIVISALSGIKCNVDYLYNGMHSTYTRNTPHTTWKKAVMLSSTVIYVITCFWEKFLFSMWIAFNIGSNQIHGVLAFLIIIFSLVIFPVAVILAISPLLRYNGPKTLAWMINRTPEILVLSFTTEYVAGIIDNGIQCHSCTRCCTGENYSPGVCCYKHWDPVQTDEVLISRKLSWGKMIYLKVIMLPITIAAITNCCTGNVPVNPLILSYVWLTLLPLGLVCFGIDL